MSEQALPPAYGQSAVARGRSHLSRNAKLGLLAGCGLCIFGVGAVILSPKARRDAEPSSNTSADWNSGLPMPDRSFRTALVPTVPTAAAVPAAQSAPVNTTPVVLPAAPRTIQVWEDTNASNQAAQQRAAPRATERDSASSDPDVATPGGASRSEYAARMQTTKFADAAPAPHRFHVQYTLKKGTIFPCTPASPISSGLPGPVQCTVGQDVWSMDGTTILLPRGTQVNGTVERGLANGDERLFLVWTDALTPRPDLLAIPLDSPAADEMGQTGVPGDVNDHLWKRIKTALLLSAVDIAGSAVTAGAQRGSGNTNLNLGGIGNTTQSLGQMAFGRDLNVPSTLYRGPGQALTVYVNHYIDLFHFYENRARR